MNIYRFGWVGALVGWAGAFPAFEVVGAEAAPQLCARGDSACYTQQHASACAPRGQPAPQSCLEWVVSLDQRANSGDRAALRAQADAYGFLATYFTKGVVEQETAKQSALKKYRELISSDPEDSDAMVGIATFSESPAERIQLLREVVRTKPHPITVNTLIGELRKLDTTAAVLEAAKVADDYQRVSNGGTKWRFAAEAVDLYKAAGDSERAADVRQRAQQEVGVSAVLRELSTIRVSNPSRAAELLASICNSLIARTIGAKHCLDALELTVPSLRQISDRQEAQRLADRTAATMEQLAREARPALAEADPDWYPRVLGLLDRIPAQGFGSVMTWAAIAKVDRTQGGRTRALEGAVSFAPDNASLLSELAVSYREQRRWDEAIALYRRAKAVTPLDRVDLQRDWDRGIQAAEAMRAAGPAPSPR
jgi:tetratricopeptide (TPR) repeat protein